MTTEDIIIHIFCHVDNALGQVGKDPCAKLYPNEVVTIGILFALKGGYFRAFYRWLKRGFDGLFGGLPDRTNVACQLYEHRYRTNALLVEPSVLNVAGSYPMELIFPIREGHSKQQVDGKNKDKGRWGVGVNLCWVLNTLGQVCGWIWDTLNCPDNSFLDFLAEFDQEGI